jgi:hypothetical protein
LSRKPSHSTISLRGYSIAQSSQQAEDENGGSFTSNNATLILTFNVYQIAFKEPLAVIRFPNGRLHVVKIFVQQLFIQVEGLGEGRGLGKGED